MPRTTRAHRRHSSAAAPRRGRCRWWLRDRRQHHGDADRIVIKSLEAEQTTASGLVIPDTAKEKPQEGEVLAVGPGRIDDKGNRVPLDINVGDRVIYSKYGGTEVKHGGQEYLILSARDILAIVS